ncbi:MAG: hypothetical protein ACRD0Z_13820 [Acidimicrobiales bacterium]
MRSQLTALAAAGCLALGCLAAAPVATLVASSTGQATSPIRQTPARASSSGFVSPSDSYDIVTAEGGVLNFGGAGWYGNERSRHLIAPIVGISVTRDGGGYWLVGANGSVFNLGDSKWYGSLAHESLGSGQSIVGMAATATNKGYWLFNQSGAVISFGDARPINGGNPLPPADLSTPIVAGAIDPTGLGAWLIDAAGNVYNVGAAGWYGSQSPLNLVHPIVAIASVPSGRGYWLANSAGMVWGFGSAVTGLPAPAGVQGNAVGIAAAGSSNGYWVATNVGQVVPGGDAVTRGQSTPGATESSAVGIAPAPQVQTTLPPDSVGYDINWPQCAGPSSSGTANLPGPPGDYAGSSSFTLAVVGVDGWATEDFNSCLAAEVAWAKQARYPAGSGLKGIPPYDLYMFLNSPSADSTIDSTGPAGTCADLTSKQSPHCLAYNYGYNSALGAVQYAEAQGAYASVWWLDIENDICAPGDWNDEADGEWWSCDRGLNDLTIQGAIAALRRSDITPGIYCTHVQWQDITGGYVPHGGMVSIWIAGAPYSSPPYPADWSYPSPAVDPTYCSNAKYAFAGGTPVTLQETPGNGYVFDPDLAC